MTTTRAVRDDIQNTLDFLVAAELALYANTVTVNRNRVSWQSHNPSVPFLSSREHPDIEQYVTWVTAGAYSASLFDGSLLQLTYDIDDGEVSGHRLAYVPCPYDLDRALLTEGMPLADVVDLCRDKDAAMRSPIRFDYDPQAAKDDHPAAHLTLNTADCRIECAAPLHVLRFVDFVFRHFYPKLWRAHRPFFTAAAWRHVEVQRTGLRDRHAIHLMWDVNATRSTVGGE